MGRAAKEIESLFDKFDQTAEGHGTSQPARVTPPQSMPAPKLTEAISSQPQRVTMKPGLPKFGLPKFPDSPTSASPVPTPAPISENPAFVSINVNIPQLADLEDFELPAWPYRKIALIASGLILALLVSSSVSRSLHRPKSTAKAKVQTATASADISRSGIVPLISPNLAASGGPKLAYDEKHKVVGYPDFTNGVGLNLSIQALPENLKTDSGALATVATNIGAKQSYDTARGKFYVATNPSNQQVGVFATDQALVFVKAERVLDQLK
jgi:hypothetical protein